MCSAFPPHQCNMYSIESSKPDGFTGLFYRLAWDAIKQDIMKAIRTLESAGNQGFHLLNNALMILLPKSPAAASPSEFRPISLIHSFGKLFTKLLATRLQPFMHELISPCQNAFIRGRSIHDNFMYVQGMIKSLKQKKTPALLMKLDISKAFDSVSWPFLCKLLAQRGFNPKWIDCVAVNCLYQSPHQWPIIRGDLPLPWIEAGRPSVPAAVCYRHGLPRKTF